ncbi:MAG: sigma-54-dependent Fis family transcriptional regulator [Alphaproteobacteria bacterium]|nr:sigma-54-dependent Fis family transcriptional regulator [Alphaproteobacteria bacterium]
MAVRSADSALVLVVESAADARRQLDRIVRAAGHEAYLAGSAAEGLSALQHVTPGVVLVDLDLADMPGGRALTVFADRAGAPVVAVSEVADPERAIDAMRHGAVDFAAISDRRRVMGAIERALQEGTSRHSLDSAQQAVRDSYGFKHLVSQSPRMLEVFDKVQAVASTDATVLVRGETGTGKELIARAIHERSKRRTQPMISVNCGAFTESLLESELFGHEKGSFTGASGRREGVFEMAHGGTLFLDELGETTLNVQVNLLRVLEEFRFRRVGGRDLVDVDVRIVAATNVRLEEAVSEGRFRQDLFYRLNVFPIELPPLRERSEDIPLLMRHFLDEISEEYELDPPVVSAEALDAILRYRWPGNVRQLRAMCERWVIVRPGQRLEREHLPSSMTDIRAAGTMPGTMAIDDHQTLKDNTTRVVEQLERAYLYRQLRRNGGHLQRTADAAGITRRTLYTKMKQYGLDAGDFRGGPADGGS